MKIKDIAEKAGVSTATVSNVINGNYNQVSQATIEKIKKIMEELDYTPSATARSLDTHESRIIGVLIPYLGEDQSFDTNPYISQIIGTLENYIRRQGYYLLLRGAQKCREMVSVFSSWNVDGAIILAAMPSEVSDLENGLKFPTVYLDTYAQDLGIANVGVDDYKGGFLAARYLLGKGHRKIALVSPDISTGVMEARYRGFCDAMKERNVEFTKEQCFEATPISSEGIKAGKKIAMSRQGFTAVAVMSDTIAIGVINGLRTYGLNVPRDISVIGFGNLPVCQCLSPGLTTISQNIKGKAEAACELLFNMIRNEEKIAVDKVLDVELVERQSVKDLRFEYMS